MAFGRGRTGGGGDADTGATAPGAEGQLTAFIDQGSSFEGKLSFKDTVRIDGHFAGQITSENTLIVGESGEIEAEIRSEVVIVAGTVNGDVVARRKLVLHKTAHVTGDVETPTLVVEEGAVFNGQLRMGESRPKGDASRLRPVEGGRPGKPASDAGDEG